MTFYCRRDQTAANQISCDQTSPNQTPWHPFTRAMWAWKILLSGAILIENFLSFQIDIAIGSDKYLRFSQLCKHHVMVVLLSKI